MSNLVCATLLKSPCGKRRRGSFRFRSDDYAVSFECLIAAQSYGEITEFLRMRVVYKLTEALKADYDACVEQQRVWNKYVVSA